MVSYFLGRLFNYLSIFFYRIRLNKIGKKMNNIENWFFGRGWIEWLQVLKLMKKHQSE